MNKINFVDICATRNKNVQKRSIGQFCFCDKTNRYLKKSFNKNHNVVCYFLINFAKINLNKK